jgi:hypothetical protein
MKDVLTGLVAVMAAFATLAALLIRTDVSKLQSKLQSKLANDEGLEVADAFVKAQRRVTLQRNILLVLPCAAALVFRPGGPIHS